MVKLRIAGAPAVRWPIAAEAGGRAVAHGVPLGAPACALLGVRAFSSPGSSSSMPSHGDRKSKLRNSWRQLHRLVDDALLLVVVAQLDIAGQRKILAQRMPLEAVIGEDAAQIGMIGEKDAEEIPGLALEPAGGAEEPR